MRILGIACVATAMIAMPSLANAMGIGFDWGPTKKCFDPKSPPITVSGIPKGTKKLRFHLVDLNAIDFNHGGGTVEYKGSSKFAYGAFRYMGPCPPEPHTYQMSVEALDAGGKVLGKAKATRKFPR